MTILNTRNTMRLAQPYRWQHASELAQFGVLMTTCLESGQCSAWIGIAHVHTLLDEYDKAHFGLESAEALATDNHFDEEIFHIFCQRGNLYFITVIPEVVMISN